MSSPSVSMSSSNSSSSLVAVRSIGEFVSGTANVRALGADIAVELPDGVGSTLGLFVKAKGFSVRKSALPWVVGLLENPLLVFGFEKFNLLPGLICELPSIDEGGGGPAGVKELVDDVGRLGGGPAGVVVGWVPKPLPPIPRALKPRRESGVDGELEDMGTVNPPGIVRLRSPRSCKGKSRHSFKGVWAAQFVKLLPLILLSAYDERVELDE